MHVIVDGFRGDSSLLASTKVVFDFLNRIPAIIGMTKIDGPRCLAYNGGDKPQDSGVTGTVIIAESHISIHTFDKRRQAWIDIFSCKEFNPMLALREIVLTFAFELVQPRLLERGLEYPHNIDQAIPLAAFERGEAALVVASSAPRQGKLLRIGGD